MDPVACWSALLDAIDAKKREHITDNAETLIDWIEGGGFLPRMVNVMENPEAEFLTKAQFLFHLYQVRKVARCS